MTTYKEVNGAWPEATPVPTSQEAIVGTKRLIRRAFALAKAEGCVGFLTDYGPYMQRKKFKITTGNRYTYPRNRVWYVNPKGEHFGGWRDIVHFVSHWAHRRFWPKEGSHSIRHVWLEKELTDYAVANFLAGQLAMPEPAAVDPKAARAARVAARITAWEAKARRADNALRKLRRQAHYYGLPLSNC